MCAYIGVRAQPVYRSSWDCKPVISDILLFLIFPFFIIRKSHVVEPKSIAIMSENKEDIYNAVAYQLNEPIYLNEALFIFNEF